MNLALFEVLENLYLVCGQSTAVTSRTLNTKQRMIYASIEVMGEVNDVSAIPLP